jgi:hypothetical protein
MAKNIRIRILNTAFNVKILFFFILTSDQDPDPHWFDLNPDLDLIEIKSCVRIFIETTLRFICGKC